MDSILLFKQNNFSKTIWWKSKTNLKGYKNQTGPDLVTEIVKGRVFKIADHTLSPSKLLNKSRILVQFFEDGYICWIDIDQLNIDKVDIVKHYQILLDQLSIQKKIPKILEWIQIQSKRPNKYLWGGTIGPNYDCSGLIQTAFFLNQIYMPRDSYQMQVFCKHLFYFSDDNIEIKMGDILFFGPNKRCNHVGIYYKDGYYFHSSGQDDGRNGIALDSINQSNSDDSISKYYRSILISVGRVIRSYQWNKTIR